LKYRNPPVSAELVTPNLGTADRDACATSAANAAGVDRSALRNRERRMALLPPVETATRNIERPAVAVSDTDEMTVSRSQRRAERRDRVVAVFGEHDAERALELLELMGLAWHDCYSEVSPPEGVIDDVLTLSEGSLAGLIAAARLAVIDWRDVRINATAIRAGRAADP
jgi:hypothetical protein